MYTVEHAYSTDGIGKLNFFCVLGAGAAFYPPLCLRAIRVPLIVAAPIDLVAGAAAAVGVPPVHGTDTVGATCWNGSGFNWCDGIFDWQCRHRRCHGSNSHENCEKEAQAGHDD